MTKRIANITILPSRGDSQFLVAVGCPHPLTENDAFRSCKCAVRVENPENKEGGWAQIATCQFLGASIDKPADDARLYDRLITCTYVGGRDAVDSEPIGHFGIPDVAHRRDA